jgi:hypothetical protein
MAGNTAQADIRRTAAPVLARSGNFPDTLLHFRSPSNAVDAISTAVAVIGILGLALRRWLLVGPYPPGLDGAQWLAIGRGFHGVGRSSSGAYAPLAPALATVAEAVVGPLPALRLLAVASTLALSGAIYLVARSTLGSLGSLVVTSLVVPASALAEPVLYGGYPQQLALAAGVIALWAACRFLSSANKKALCVVGVSFLFTAVAHHVYFPLLVLSLLVSSSLWLLTVGFRAGWRSIVPLVLVCLPGFALFVFVASRFLAAGYSAPLDPSLRSPIVAWQYATRESPFLWLVLLVLAIVSLIACWHERSDPAWLMAAGLILPSTVLLLAYGQPRLAPPLLIGTAIAVCLGGRRLAGRWRGTTLIVAAAAIAIPILLLLPADRVTATYADFYHVVDASFVRAAAAIANDGGSGGVAVRQDHRGWPIGWWLEALQTKPVLVGSDAKWLGFPDERRRAEEAARLFDGSITPATFEQRVSALDVAYIVIPKWDWIGWDRWLREPDFPVSVLFDDDRLLVLRVASSAKSAGV